MLNEEQLKEKYELAMKLNLSGAELLLLEDALEECNGIGADWFPTWLRWLITSALPSLEVIADIHDMRYFIGGHIPDRKFADKEFEENGEKVALQYNALNPRRYLIRKAVKLMYAILVVGGWTAFNYKHDTEAQKDV